MRFGFPLRSHSGLREMAGGVSLDQQAIVRRGVHTHEAAA
jgi:hypothetical protein